MANDIPQSTGTDRAEDAVAATSESDAPERGWLGWVVAVDLVTETIVWAKKYPVADAIAATRGEHEVERRSELLDEIVDRQVEAGLALSPELVVAQMDPDDSGQLLTDLSY